MASQLSRRSVPNTKRYYCNIVLESAATVSLKEVCAYFPRIFACQLSRARYDKEAYDVIMVLQARA